MKLLHVLPSLDPLGGGPIEGVRLLSREMLRLGHSVEIASLDAPGAQFEGAFDVPVHCLGPSLGSYRLNTRITSWLTRNATRFDAVIVNGIWQFHSYSVWRALSGSGTPYFVFTHGMLDPWFKRAYPFKHLKKWLYWPWAEYRVLRDAKAVIFTCEEERVLARESFWLYKVTEEVTSYGASEPPPDEGLSSRFRSIFPQLQGKRICLFLGRVHEKKGCDLLIKAFSAAAAAHPDLHLVMAGPDQTGWIAKLKQLAEQLQVADRITWPGMLRGEDKWGAFYAADVFCLPSHQENFGIVVAEALACGRPVLISNKVNIWREIHAANAGFVQDDTLEGTLKALEQWLALTPDAKLVMERSARRSFDTNFRVDRVAQSLVGILERHLAAGRCPPHESGIA